MDKCKEVLKFWIDILWEAFLPSLSTVGFSLWWTAPIGLDKKISRIAAVAVSLFFGSFFSLCEYVHNAQAA